MIFHISIRRLIFKEANEKIGISRIESIRILEEMLTEQIGI